MSETTKLELLLKRAIRQALATEDRDSAAELSALLYYLSGQEPERPRYAA